MKQELVLCKLSFFNIFLFGKRFQVTQKTFVGEKTWGKVKIKKEKFFKGVEAVFCCNLVNFKSTDFYQGLL